jgi:hypothetical protein
MPDSDTKTREILKKNPNIFGHSKRMNARENIMNARRARMLKTKNGSHKGVETPATSTSEA